MKIVFTTYLPVEGFTRLSEHNLVFPQAAYATREELKNAIIDADILVATFDYKVDASILEHAAKLQYIANFGSGYNNIDLAYCAAHNILITNTPAPVVEPTAEHALTLMLGIAHRVAELDYRLRHTNDVQFGVMNNLGVSLYGKTLGIIGMGNIGKALAKRAIACGMQIIYHNRKPINSDYSTSRDECSASSPKSVSPLYIESIDELLAQSDFISLNLPYTPQTHHLISTAEFKQMKPTAILINTARGAHVDEQALIHALQTKQIAAAALDVYEHEPQIADELKALPNVLLSPHIGTGTIDGRLAMCECVTDNILAFLNNEHDKMNLV